MTKWQCGVGIDLTQLGLAAGIGGSIASGVVPIGLSIASGLV
jgi:hypothetical protein